MAVLGFAMLSANLRGGGRRMASSPLGDRGSGVLGFAMLASLGISQGLPDGPLSLWERVGVRGSGEVGPRRAQSNLRR